MTRRHGTILGFAALAIALGAIGYWMLFSTFAGYDDEGYILISARTYWEHGGLYDQVYSQYGPAFYVVTDAIQSILRSPLTHTSARILTLALWWGTAFTCAGLVFRITASGVLCFFTAAATFLYLHFVPDEPFHPGTFIIFLLPVSIYAATGLISRGAWRSAAILAGAIGAVLTLMKANVGVFYFAGLAGWGLLHANSERLRRIALLAGPFALVLLAAILMKPLWGATWITVYLTVFGVGAITVSLALCRDGMIARSEISWLFTATISVAVFVIAVVCVRGTTFHGLLEGVLLEPMRHATSYSYPVDWRPGTVLAAGVSLALCFVHLTLRRRGLKNASDRLIITLRVLETLGLLTGLALLMEARAIGAIFSFVAPSLWIWVVPLTRGSQPPEGRLASGFLASILLLQYLQAFPIGGIQEAWGTFLFIPLVALGLGEIRAWCIERASVDPKPIRHWQRGAVLIVLIVTAKTAWTGSRVHATYASRRILDLPGAEMLRLPERQRTAYRILSLNAAVHAEVLFSLPGMFSFNLFTDLPTPTTQNTTVWFTLLDPQQQQETVNALERSRRACLIVEERLVDLMRQINVPVAGPLRDYIFHRFTPLFRLDGMAFMVPNDQTVAPLCVAELAPISPVDSDTADRELIFRMAGEGTAIVVIEASALDGALPSAPQLNSTNSVLNVTPIDRSGRATAPSHATSWPLRITGLAAVSIRFRANAVDVAGANVFRLKSAAGETVAEARFSD